VRGRIFAPAGPRFPEAKEKTMKALTVTTVAAFSLAFSAAAMANTMSKEEYKAGKETIQAEYKAAKADCDRFTANIKDICIAEAKGRENVALAELGERYHPGPKASYDVRMAKAEAAYALAKEKCDDMAGNKKDVCVKEAKSAHTAAKADAKAQMKTAEANKTASEKSAKARGKANKEIGEARKDADVDKRDAAYAVAVEKCDILSGSDKDLCVSRAKQRYGKS
jgi:hypothetical protein